MSEELNTEAITAEVNAILTEGGALQTHVSYNGAWLVSASFPCRGYGDDGEGGMSGAVGPKAYAGDTRRTNGDPRDLAAQFVADAQAHAAKMEAFFSVAPEPEQVETPGHESDGETGEASVLETDGLEADQEPLSGSESPEVFTAHPGGGEGAGETEPVDAEFDVADLGGPEELADPDFESLALEGADAEPEAPAQDGPIAYGASTIDGLIREKLGRVSQIARELKAIQQEGWTLEEYAYLQNLMVRMDRGEAPDDQASRERFLAIAMKSQAMSRIDSVRDRKEGELEEIGQRRDFDAAVYYEPNEGWP